MIKLIRDKITAPNKIITFVMRKNNNQLRFAIFNYDPTTWREIPFSGCLVKAGFPSPADDHIEQRLDLNKHLIKHPAATFFVRASGDSMENALIQNGDILIVDRSVEPIHGKIVIAILNGEFTVKRLWMQAQRLQLLSENDSYPPIFIDKD